MVPGIWVHRMDCDSISLQSYYVGESRSSSNDLVCENITSARVSFDTGGQHTQCNRESLLRWEESRVALQMHTYMQLGLL